MHKSGVFGEKTKNKKMLSGQTDRKPLQKGGDRNSECGDMTGVISKDEYPSGGSLLITYFLTIMASRVPRRFASTVGRKTAE